MQYNTKAEEIVLKSIDRLNELRPADNAVPKALGTILLGAGAILDSMDYVNFVVAVEEQAAESLGLSLNFTQALNEVGKKDSKPATVGELIDFLATRLVPS